jgi:hypothetical protein
MLALTSALAWRHTQFAQDVQAAVAAPLEAVRDRHKTQVAQAVTASTAAQREYVSHRAALPRLRKTYEAKCKDLDAAREELALPMVRPPCLEQGARRVTVVPRLVQVAPDALSLCMHAWLCMCLYACADA